MKFFHDLFVIDGLISNTLLWYGYTLSIAIFLNKQDYKWEMTCSLESSI